MITDILNLALLPFRGYALFNIMCGILVVTGLFQLVWNITFSGK